MPRGGKRKGAGRKSSWQNNDTCVIRVPKMFAQQLLKIAHALDEGRSLEFATKSKQISLDFLSGPGPLGQRDLAKRLGISNGTIGSNKKRYGPQGWRRFAKWTYSYDPDDLHWVFDESTKKYYVIDYAAELAKEIQHYQR